MSDQTMRYKLLGNSGLRVSELCLGAMTFGEDWGWGSSKDEARKIYDAFREAGGNFIDTANIYTLGASESFLGEFMADHREDVVLATKYTNAFPGRGPNVAGNQRKNMMESVEASLKRLNTDYIDLYWLHIWDKMTPLEEVMRAFDDLVRQGKVLYVGISDAPAWVVSRCNTMAELRGWSPFIGLQIEYSLMERAPERDLLPMAEALNIGVTAWSPLAGGILTGKYAKGEAGDARYTTDMMKDLVPPEERQKAVVPAVLSVAEEVGVSAAQIALAWLRHRSIPIIPILGARKMHQLEDNIASLGVKLTTDQLATLDDASRIELGFPHDLLDREFVRTITSGGYYDLIDA